MRLLSLLLLLLSSTLATAQFEYIHIWDEIEPFPLEARDDAVSFKIGNARYVGTGINDSYDEKGDFAKMTGTSWDDQVASLPQGEERQYAAGCSDGTFGYVFGGISNGINLNDLWRYDPQSNSWVELSPVPSAGRSGMVMAYIEPYIYVMGGAKPMGDVTDEVWRYNVGTDQWDSLPPMPLGERWRAAATAHEDVLYFLMGRDNNGAHHSDAWLFSPDSGWSALPNLPRTGLTYAKCTFDDDGLLVFGGSDVNGDFEDRVWEFEPITSTWSIRDTLENFDARRGGSMFSFESQFDGFIYIGGLTEGLSRTVQTLVHYRVAVTPGPSTAFRLYPNPTNIWLSIDFNGSLEELSIFSLSGTLVFHAEQQIDYGFVRPTGISMRVDDLGLDLANGTYVIRLKTTEGEHVGRLIVSRL